nr:hypothetical protein [Tanacetum cinerariifolium]
TEDLDTYDSECGDISNAKAVIMANISNCGSDVILEVPNSETYLNDMENQSVHAMQDFKQSPVVDFPDNKINSDSNIIAYSQYLQETQQENVQDTNLQAQQDSMILFVIEQMSEQMINHTEDLDTYDYECGDILNAKAALMANISNCGSDVISEVPNYETYLNDMENQSVHAMQDFKQSPVVDFLDNKINSDSNIIAYS